MVALPQRLKPLIIAVDIAALKRTIPSSAKPGLMGVPALRRPKANFLFLRRAFSQQ